MLSIHFYLYGSRRDNPETKCPSPAILENDKEQAPFSVNEISMIGEVVNPRRFGRLKRQKFILERHIERLDLGYLVAFFVYPGVHDKGKVNGRSKWIQPVGGNAFLLPDNCTSI